MIIQREGRDELVISQTIMNERVFKNLDFHRAILEFDLCNSKFINVDMRNAKVRNIMIENTSFHNSRLILMNIENVEFRNCEFSESDIKYCRFVKCIFDNNILYNCNINDVEYIECTGKLEDF